MTTWTTPGPLARPEADLTLDDKVTGTVTVTVVDPGQLHVTTEGEPLQFRGKPFTFSGHFVPTCDGGWMHMVKDNGVRPRVKRPDRMFPESDAAAPTHEEAVCAAVSNAVNRAGVPAEVIETVRKRRSDDEWNALQKRRADVIAELDQIDARMAELEK